jgi:hypothetical protein
MGWIYFLFLLMIIPVGGNPENWHGQIRVCLSVLVCVFFPHYIVPRRDPVIPPDGYE